MLLLHASGGLDDLEHSTLDARFQHANRPGSVDTSIVLASIDDGSIAFFRRNMRVGWPWPREYYAMLLNYLRKGGARAVVFDILFTEEDFDRGHVDAATSDERFAEAIGQAGNVTLAAQFTDADTSLDVGQPLASRHSLQEAVPEEDRRSSYRQVLAPIPLFQEEAAAIGAVNVNADPDGVVRRLPLVLRGPDGLQVPNLGLASYLATQGASRPSDVREVLSGVPTDQNGSFLLYWYGAGGPDGAFSDQYVSIRSLIVSAARMQLGNEPIVPPERFKGKTVIVGGSAAGLHDFHATPVTGRGSYPGMELFATFLSNLYQGHFLQETPPGVTALLIVLLAALGAGLVLYSSNRIGGAAIGGVGLGIVYVGAAVLVFYAFRWWIPIVAPLGALALSFTVTSAVSYAVEGRKRRQLRQVFQRYLSPQVVEEVVQDPDDLELGGKEVVGTVFFSDIEGFTTMAEGMTPREVVRRLNEYFGVTTEVVLDHQAMVDKFIGDAIMAVFGAPMSQPDHARAASFAALEMQQALSNHYGGSVNGDCLLAATRIGIHTGPLVVGNIGMPERVDYTAIGDTVNVAARLEQANKQYGTRILLSEDAYEEARGAIVGREVDLLRVTGKEQPIRVFELLGRKGQLSDRQEEKRRIFEQGLSAYRRQHWNEARDAFMAVLRIAPNDGPATVYLRRIDQRAGATLPADWQAVHDMNLHE